MLSTPTSQGSEQGLIQFKMPLVLGGSALGKALERKQQLSQNWAEPSLPDTESNLSLSPCLYLLPLNTQLRAPFLNRPGHTANMRQLNWVKWPLAAKAGRLRTEGFLILLFK